MLLWRRILLPPMRVLGVRIQAFAAGATTTRTLLISVAGHVMAPKVRIRRVYINNACRHAFAKEPERFYKDKPAQREHWATMVEDCRRAGLISDADAYSWTCPF